MANIDYSLLKGKFITFEGGEGSGKSTQIFLLSDYLKSQNCNVILTREPGGTSIGNQIRKILLDPENTALSPTAELLLYNAARAQHMGELIYPGMQNGSVVLCDRFSDATKAYQGYGRGLDTEVIDKYTALVTTMSNGRRIVPDITFLFDIDAETGLKRARGREAKKAAGNQETRFENETLKFHERIRNGYLDIARKEPDRFRLIDATGTIEQIYSNIIGTLDNHVMFLSKNHEYSRTS